MNIKKQIPDRIFREKLEGLSVGPPPDTFEKIQARLKQKKRKTIVLWYRSVAAAAVVVFALTAGWYFNNNTKNPLPEMQNISEVTTIKPQSREKSTDENNISEKTDLVQNTENKNLIAEANPNDFNLGSKTNTKQMDSGTKMIPESINREVNHLSLLKRIEAILESIYPLENLTPVGRKNSNSLITNYERDLIALNTSVTNINNADNKWEVGFRISPGYSSQSSSHTELYSQNMTYSNTEGNSDISGGFSVEYKAAKRLSIESGIYYSQNGQQSGNSPHYFYDNLFASSDKESAADYFNTPVEIKDGKMLMNSTAGVIIFKGTPENAELSANFDRNGEYSNALLTESEFSQVFDFIEIPVLLKYNIIDRKIAVDLVGGFSANWIVGNNVYIGEGSDREYIGKTSDISSLNYSGTLGIGVDYALSKRLSVSVDPRLNYFLNSINKNSAVDYKPYRLGVYTGFSYNF